MTDKEVIKFEADTQKVLDIMIHSLYSDKDIFLRELIANSTDAIDKARFLSLKDKSISEDWTIRIDADKDNKVLKITDNGIGMTKDEVIENIGTIAKSGTKAFLQAIEQKKDNQDSPELIGQFGVGFYSAFMIADDIVLETKKAGSDEPAVKWKSKGEAGYSLEESNRADHGTTISLHLKEDADKYLDNWKVKEIVKKYSDFIEYPIKMENTVKEPIEQTEDEKEEKKDIEYTDVVKDDILNSQKAIWLRPANEIKEEEYNQFFKHLSHAFEDPIKHIHYSAEGKSEFKALIYIPSKNPFNMFTPDTRNKNLHLYIRRIFITDECPNLLPEYLRFIDGVVDSTDLPLNVSRETLQDNPGIERIQKNLVRKIIKTLDKIKSNEPEKYTDFFKEFGRFIKEGVHSDHENKEKLQELLLFESMKNDAGKQISLKDYVDVMPSDQKEIYYIIGENRNILENSPHLEMFRSKGYDVLYMTDPIDEFVVQGLFKYADKDVKSVGKGNIKFDTDKKDKEKTEEAKKEYASLLEFMQKHLESDIKEVRFSNRLTDSACCLVGGDFDQSAYMEKIMKAMNQDMPKSKRILELNPDHPIVSSLNKLFAANPKDSKLGDFSEMLYDQALLTEGSPIAHPLKFSKRVAELMVMGLNSTTSSDGVETSEVIEDAEVIEEPKIN